MFFDSHAHLDDMKYEQDRDEVIDKLKEQGTELVMNVGSDIASSKSSVVLSKRYDFIYAAVGVHPSDTGGLTKSDLQTLSVLAQEPKVMAIGEIGLDYYYDAPLPSVQKKWFEEQLALANELDKPIIIHNRDAYKDCLDILKRFNLKKNGGIMHCFSGSVEYARQVLALGLDISVGGPVTFKNAVKTVEVVREIPLSHILIETDSPYLTPVPHRGERNTPGYVRHTAEKIAEIKGISLEEVAMITMQNAKRVYRIG